ncbi:YdcH family protein [Pseudorhodoferax sp. Leaf267]|uniref:YdcH family protein n=1 Tax=Pseudorhodoferax sp. Leaf267 TaxID=1736316 RepID=UPI0006FEB30A|nr:YdcH family protein [Pseudorhodoferax sp. Leaf267]KQP12306.1 hypothetical protein ASF43_22670 [Pseudorhodoferax sp. Leaf267]
MFPEYRDLIAELKRSDVHFLHLFDKHNALDQRIKNMEARTEAGTPDEIEVLKKKKLLLKDQLYGMLQKARPQG